ncbi:hypothetical protein V8C44DRAFT_204961 [Trichoderma aethiopicum]
MEGSWLNRIPGFYWRSSTPGPCPAPGPGHACMHPLKSSTGKTGGDLGLATGFELFNRLRVQSSIVGNSLRILSKEKRENKKGGWLLCPTIYEYRRPSHHYGGSVQTGKEGRKILYTSSTRTPTLGEMLAACTRVGSWLDKPYQRFTPAFRAASA